MKTFMQWVETQNLELPVVTDSEPADKATVSEKAARVGIGANYPDAYVRNAYMDKNMKPSSYFMPKPDALYKMDKLKDIKTPPNTAAN